MTVIVDYGVGNLFSLRSSFEAVGAPAEVSGDASVIRSADRIVLPGVGAFGDAAARLRGAGLDRALREAAEAGIPLLGICLGMQLLLERSLEFGEHEGLGLIPGTVRSLTEIVPPGRKIPHIGWNSLTLSGNGAGCPLFRHLPEDPYVYFVHSFAGTDCGDSVIAVTDYGAPVTAAVARGPVYGVQFHPEKSGPAGLSILRAFSEMKA